MRLPAGLEAEAEKIKKEAADPQIVSEGTQVFAGYLPAAVAERFTRAWAGLSGQRMDWCYQGGRMFVLAMGDLEQVEWARPLMMSLYEQLQKPEGTVLTVSGRQVGCCRGYPEGSCPWCDD